MHTLVTGGAGFIGSHLARALRARGDDVRILDDLSTGRADRVPSGCTLLHGDLRCSRTLERALADIDRVLHLGAAVGPGLVARDPGGTWSRNAEGTRRLLAACARRGLGVLFTSSSEVYDRRGPGPARPFREEDPVGGDPRDRRSVYARSKLAGERAARTWALRLGLPVVVARLFNVVGPGQSPRHGMVLARFVAAARAGRPLTIYGDGNQRRCFLHVQDAVAALLALLDEPGARGRVLNVGAEEELSVGDLARRVGAVCARPVALQHVPLEAVYGAGFGDPRWRRPDVTRLQRLTGWRPRLGVDDAIRDAWAASEREAQAAPDSLGGGVASASSISAPKPSATARSTH